MKYRIQFENGKWTVIEPGGEVRWHFATWADAFAWVARNG